MKDNPSTTSAVIGDDGLMQGLFPAVMPFGHPTVAALADALQGDAPALIDSASTSSYDDLGAAVRAGSAALQGLGLDRGDRIAAACGNHNALIIAFLASQRLGLVWVGINRVLAGPEKCAQLADCEARLLLCDSATAAQIAELHDRVPHLERVLITSTASDADWPLLIDQHAGQDAVLAPVDRLAPASISYTSGTTGTPKGAVHTQHSMMTFVNGGLYSGNGGIWEANRRRSVTIALTILNGMTYGPLAALGSGGSFVSMDRIDAAGVTDWIERTAIEILCCTPPTIRDILTRPELQGRDVSSLRYVMAGGAAGATELRKIFKDRIGSEMIDEYGMTEAPSGVAGGRYDWVAPGKAVGRAYPHVQIETLDADAQPLPRGSVGEIGLRAPLAGPWANVFTGMTGYWRKPQETALTLREGWLCTGDLGIVDDHGNLSIVGRLKELIIRGGANVYPSEVERVVRGLDEVEDTVVVGMPDPRLGEIVCAFLKLKDADIGLEGLADRMTAACRAELASYKVPERWYIVDDIPRNAMNKPLRSQLMDVPRREALRG